MNKRLPGVAVVLTFSGFLSILPAQSAKLQSEIKFIRELVTELRFVDLAQYEVSQLKKNYKDSSDFKLVAQLDIEISLQGAKRHPDRATRRSLYKQALEQSSEFIDRYSADDVAMDARVTQSEACIEFGKFLNEELEIAREESPDLVKELEEEAAGVFRKGVQASNKCQQGFDAKGRSVDAFVSWMRRGILLREHARAVPKDRSYLADQAAEAFEELILEVGEETILGQKALFEMSKIEEVKGDLAAAIGSYTDAIEAIWEALTTEDVDLPESAQRLMFTMMQEVYDRLATVMFMQGQTQEILEKVKELDARVAEFQTELDPNFGDSLQLTKAQVMASSSAQAEVSEALKTAKRINERHPNDFVGLKAKNLIRDILRHSSSLVTGDLLLEVAKGDYQAKSYDAAIAGFKRSLNGMDEPTRKRLGYDTWVLIGRSNQFMQRYLEAAMAYSRALSEYGLDMKASGDKDAKDKLKQTARKASNAVNRVVAAAGGDQIFTSLKATIEEQLGNFDEDQKTAGDYQRGLRAKSSRKYEEAARFFFEVKASFPKHELALGHGIECLFKAKKYDEAKTRIAELRAYVKSTPIAEDDRERRSFRPQALAWAHYTEGRILYERTRGKDGGVPDLTRFKDVEKHFLEFETVHGKSAQSQMAKVHEMLGHAYLEMGEETKATERYNKLKLLGETTPDVHKALGIFMFNAFSDQAQALETEIQGLFKEGKPTEASETKLRAVRQKTVNMGLDYAKSVGKPAYEILYNTMRLSQRLKDWSKCEWTSEKILKLYSKSKYKSLRQIKPLLGFALLRQPGRMQEALDVLKEAEKELEAGKKTSAFYDVLRYKALALGGWPAFDKDGINYEPNPGMGKPEEAYAIYWGNDYRKYALNKRRTPPYSLDWYQYHLEVYYFCRQAQRIDAKFKARAETFYNKARSVDDFATLKSLGPEGVRLSNLFAQIK